MVVMMHNAFEHRLREKQIQGEQTDGEGDGDNDPDVTLHRCDDRQGCIRSDFGIPRRQQLDHEVEQRIRATKESINKKQASYKVTSRLTSRTICAQSYYDRQRKIEQSTNWVST